MSKNSKLTIGAWRYDRTQALFDGRVGIDGYDVTIIDAPLEELFSRAFIDGEFDVAELSFSNFLRLSAAGKCPYVGLPVFPSRSFRHGAFYVRDGGKVTVPADLQGKRVGVREYSMTAALAARGALRDHYGVRPEDIHWVTGDVDHKERDTIPLPDLFKPISIEVAPNGQFLDQMLLDGELDAVLAYKPLKSFKEEKGTRRLIADHAVAEADYFRRTGIFPIMHLMGIRKDIASVAGLPQNVVKAFEAAKQIASDDLHAEQALKIGLPWIAEELRRTVTIMGEDFWPNGMAANRKVLSQMITWSYEDGLIPERPTIDSLFVENG